MHWKICCQLLIDDTSKGTKISAQKSQHYPLELMMEICSKGLIRAIGKIVPIKIV